MLTELLIFDLDGTLIDGQIDVGRALNRVLADHHLEPFSAEIIRQHVGYGIQPILMERLRENGVTEIDAALKKFTEYYLDRCVDGTVLYEGVADLLPRLARYKKVILTNKSTRFIDKILTGLGIAEYFVSQYGRESFAKTKPDPLPILSILREHDVAPERALMIGDTETDINAGANAGIATCLVTYGYGSPAVLGTLSPTHTIRHFADLFPLLKTLEDRA